MNKTALGLGIVAAAIGVYALWPESEASASELDNGPQPQPQPSKANWPSDMMPWNVYSPATLTRQAAYNERVRQANTNTAGYDDPGDDPMFTQPYLAEDGILGPLTCGALSYWQSWGGPNVPTDCRVGNL